MVKTRVLLDRSGDATAPDGYRPIASEVEFLQSACDAEPILVRGQTLSDWAEAFYLGRQITCREVASPEQELLSVCPGLAHDQAHQVVVRLGQEFLSLERPMSVPAVLRVLYPGRLWTEPPSAAHAAEWLLWLYQTGPEDWCRPLLEHMSEEWRRHAQTPEAWAYMATSADSALQHLDAWLFIDPEARPTGLQAFPLPVPEVLVKRARREWADRLTTTLGEFYDTMSAYTLPESLREAASREAIHYYQNHPDVLTKPRFDRVSQFLSLKEKTDFYKYLPPGLPGPVPQESKDVIRWFEQQYLPYRIWQSANAVESASGDIDRVAGQFANWYLRWYPQALAGHPSLQALSFMRVGAIPGGDQAPSTLLAVLDGLHVGDAQELQALILQHSPRLLLLETSLAFSPIPTVTEFCKDALVKGAPPRQAVGLQPLGQVLSEKVGLVDQLRVAPPGRVHIWQILEPDHTYHSRIGKHSLAREVEAQLEMVAKKIADIVNGVPASVPLHIVVTTDHGRLLAMSKRTVSAPSGMVSHGRAAWGSADRVFPEAGFVIDAGLIYLHGEHFGIPNDAALCWDQSAFRSSDGKTGVEAYPHGGLYPEEVIVPWIVFGRDQARPRVEFVVSGGGQAGAPAELLVKITNLSEVDLSLVELRLDLVRRQAVIPVHRTLTKRSVDEVKVKLEALPARAEVQHCSAVMLLQQPTGAELLCEGRIDLHIDEMYHRESTLEGMDV